MKKKFICIVALVAFLAIGTIIYMPFFTADRFISSLKQGDTATIDTLINFDTFVPSLKREYRQFTLQLAKSPDARENSEVANNVASRLTEDITSASDLFGKVPFGLFRNRAKFSDYDLRFINFSTLELKFVDLDSPFLLPSFIMCREGLIKWTICKTNFDKNLISISGAKEKLFNVKAKMQNVGNYPIPPDIKIVELPEDDVMGLNQFYSTVIEAFGTKEVQVSTEPLGLKIHNKDGSFLISPRSVTMQLEDGSELVRYLIIANKQEYDQGAQSYNDCHACPGTMIGISYRYNSGVFEELKVQELGEYGVFGNIGEVLHYSAPDKKGIVLVAGSCWQGECFNWADVFEMTPNLDLKHVANYNPDRK